jgi:hypothetical protein
MLQICGLVSLFLIIAGMLTDYGEETLRPAVEYLYEAIEEQNPDLVLDDAEKDRATAETTRLLTRIMPAMTAGTLVLFQFASWYVACAIVRLSGRAKRPADHIPSELRMPRAALLAFGVGLALVVFGGTPGLVGGVIAGAVGSGFVFAGLAMLHQRLASRPWRQMALWFIYTSIIIFQLLPLVIFMLAGMLGTKRTTPPASPGSGPNINQST